MNRLFTELRVWFSSVCDCDGLNNLHDPQLECMNNTMGVLTSAVYHEGNNAATTLIDVATANMQRRNLSSVYLPSGLMVCLDQHTVNGNVMTTFQAVEAMGKLILNKTS